MTRVSQLARQWGPVQWPGWSGREWKWGQRSFGVITGRPKLYCIHQSTYQWVPMCLSLLPNTLYKPIENYGGCNTRRYSLAHGFCCFYLIGNGLHQNPYLTQSVYKQQKQILNSCFLRSTTGPTSFISGRNWMGVSGAIILNIEVHGGGGWYQSRAIQWFESFQEIKQLWWCIQNLLT